MYVTVHFIIYLLTTTLVLCTNNNNNNTKNSPHWDYCNHPDCSIKNQHTMCIAANKKSRRLIISGITKWMRNQILLLHNRHRDNVALGLEAGQPPATNMRKMYWDSELEELAEVWARQCQTRHDECRNTIRFNVLQNIDVRPVVSKITQTQLLADAVGAWFSGSRVLPPDHVWSFKAANCSAGCNANWYSTAAWGSTWRLGCSQSLCTAKKPACTLFRQKRSVIRSQRKNYYNVTPTNENLMLRRSQFLNEDFGPTKLNSKEESIQEMMKNDEAKEDLIAYTVCNYGPAGNIAGLPMYEAGTPCSNCPVGTQCVDNTHRALCSFLKDPSAKRT